MIILFFSPANRRGELWDRILWIESEIIRRVRNKGMFSIMVDFIKVTHSLNDGKELEQFHQNWTKNLSNQGPIEKFKYILAYM